MLSLLALLLAPIVGDRYLGAMMGVRAEVQLDRADHKAYVALEGLVLGGRLKGEARFDDKGGIALDATLERALRVRGVSIVSVIEQPLLHMIELRVKLPLLGVRAMALREAGAARPVTPVRAVF